MLREKRFAVFGGLFFEGIGARVGFARDGCLEHRFKNARFSPFFLATDLRFEHLRLGRFIMRKYLVDIIAERQVHHICGFGHGLRHGRVGDDKARQYKQ
ncbi:MAG: hypothetical protein ABSF34_07865 [Verrucomicrobiota bacterium]